MNRYVSVAMMLGLAWGAAGCSDALTTVPQDRISDQVFWQNNADYTLAVNAIYNRLTSDQIIYLETGTDLAHAQQYWAHLSMWARGEEAASNGTTSGYWNRLYQGISRANDVLDHLADPEGKGNTLTDAQKAEIEGQARFLRGVFYHELLWMFGEVPITTHVLTIEEGKQVKRATRDEVYAQIMSDIQAGVDKLPASWPAASKGRATKGAALAYKARAALYEASYQKYALNSSGKANTLFQTAADAALQVMTSGTYSLYSNFRNLFTYTGEGNPEVIFDYQRVKGQNGWQPFDDQGPVSMGGQAEGNSASRQLVDMFYMKDGLCPKQHSTTRIGCPLGVSPLYQDNVVDMYKDRDPRFYGTVLYPLGTLGTVTYNSFPNVESCMGKCTAVTGDKLDRGNFYNTNTGYLFMKYVDPTDQGDDTNSGINNILMRYADVLLMYAEAKAELGQFDGAVADASINKLRQRVGMPNMVLGAAAQNLALIRNERAVELAGEGLRMADLRRWRIGKTVMPGRVYGIDYLEGGVVKTAYSDDNRSFQDREYLFPIPETEINLAKNLTQNPGF